MLIIVKNNEYWIGQNSILNKQICDKITKNLEKFSKHY